MFRSAPPRGGRPRNITDSGVRGKFRSAPPRGGRQGLLGDLVEALAVSIRAPAWRATTGYAPIRDDGGVSIRAPAWRATIGGGGDCIVDTVSIRAPAWRATAVVDAWGRSYEVSIRAPAWRATPTPAMIGGKLAVSIRAPAWRATRPRRSRHSSLMFRSAPPRGGRHRRRWRWHGRCGFDPRPRVEGDVARCHQRRAHGWFRSAPPRGGRRVAAAQPYAGQPVSIRAPAWRATGGVGLLAVIKAVSIRAPAWRATVGYRRWYDGLIVVSIRAPAWRATGLPSAKTSRRSGFDPRPRVEGDGVRCAGGG